MGLFKLAGTTNWPYEDLSIIQAHMGVFVHVRLLYGPHGCHIFFMSVERVMMSLMEILLKESQLTC